MKDDPQALFHIQTPRIEQTQRPKNSRTSHRTAKEKVPILLGEKTWMKPFQISNPGVLKRNSPFQTIPDHFRPFQTSYLIPPRSVVSYPILLATAKWLHEGKHSLLCSRTLAFLFPPQLLAQSRGSELQTGSAVPSGAATIPNRCWNVRALHCWG